MSEMNGELVYIPDGYTMEGFIRREPRLHGEMSFKFRPALPRDRTNIYEEMDRAHTGEARDAVADDQIARRIVSWDVTWEGKVLPINADTVSHLSNVMRNRLFRIVLLEEPSDLRDTRPSISDQLEVAEKNS
jgi:hypothetical protein